MGVNITTIVYLRVLIIQIGSTIILMVVEAQGPCNSTKLPLVTEHAPFKGVKGHARIGRFWFWPRARLKWNCRGILWILGTRKNLLKQLRVPLLFFWGGVKGGISTLLIFLVRYIPIISHILIFGRFWVFEDDVGKFSIFNCWIWLRVSYVDGCPWFLRVGWRCLVDVASRVKWSMGGLEKIGIFIPYNGLI